MWTTNLLWVCTPCLELFRILCTCYLAANIVGCNSSLRTQYPVLAMLNSCNHTQVTKEIADHLRFHSFSIDLYGGTFRVPFFVCLGYNSHIDHGSPVQTMDWPGLRSQTFYKDLAERTWSSSYMSLACVQHLRNVHSTL